MLFFMLCSIPDEAADALGPGFFAKCGEEYIPPCWLVGVCHICDHLMLFYFLSLI